MKRLMGKRLYRGMRLDHCLAAMKMSGRWDYVANAGNEVWFRHRVYNDVIVVTHSDSGVVIDIDLLT